MGHMHIIRRRYVTEKFGKWWKRLFIKLWRLIIPTQSGLNLIKLS